MFSLSDAIFSFLLLFYCILGTNLVDKYLFQNGLSSFQLGLIMTFVFMSAYPIWGWKRNSPWMRLGQWSLGKWSLFAIGAGIATLVVDLLSKMVVRHFSI